MPQFKSDDYDLSVIQLAAETKAKPLDRLKTEQARCIDAAPRR